MPRLALPPETYDDATLVRIEAPHFVAGLLGVPGGKVVHAAPILRFMVGWDGTEVKYYCRSKGWRVEMIPTVRSRADAVRRLQRMGVIR